MIEILEAGALTTIQDLGRTGYERYGVPPSGAMDHIAFRAANSLVGNSANAAAIETALSDLSIRCWRDSLIACCGRSFQLLVNQQKMPGWTAVRVRTGDLIQIQPAGFGWAVLAFSGGLQVPNVLGSAATYLRGQLGGWQGRALMPGDQVSLKTPGINSFQRAGAYLPEELRPAYTDAPTIQVIPGPHLSHFDMDALAIFTGEVYQVRSDSDRMGYRLQGKPLPLLNGADILSEGLVLGAVQVPASGQPLVMLADRPATGGYARIATIISVDIPLFVQTPPGFGQVRFQLCDLHEAQQYYRAQQRNFQEAIAIPQGQILADASGAMD